MNQVEAGQEVVFDEVLLVGEKGKVKVGTPYVKNAKVTAKVVKNGKAKKVLVFKYKAKSNYQKVIVNHIHKLKLQISKVNHDFCKCYIYRSKNPAN